jgi:hypothetical protein
MRTKHRGVLSSVALAAVVLVSAGWRWGGGSVTIPGAARDVEGNSDNLYPFNGDPMRYQQVTTASEFPTTPCWITRIALRPDAAGGAAFTATLSNVKIRLSTTSKTPSTLSKTFAENTGSDEKVVYDGELSLTSAFSGPAAGPKDFDITIPLQNSFYYDPNLGNLLLDVRNYSTGQTTLMDAHDAPDSTGRIWSDEVDAATATRNDPFPSAGLVVKFISD